MNFRRVAASLGASGALLAGLFAISPGTAGAAGTQSFVADGTFTVPAGVTSLSVVAVGAAGGSCGSGASSGRGAIVSADIVVTPGETLTLKIGGRGGGTDSAGGANGGGAGGDVGAAGGGGTDIRRGGTTLADRVVAAGGGGGCLAYGPYIGGNGGAPDGANGVGPSNYYGKGGTQSAGGAGGLYDDPSYGIDGESGTFGQGGAGAIGYNGGGGGGGGGWYGGGGASYGDAAGGGGSSYAVPTSTNVAYSVTGNVADTPKVEITWVDPPPTTTTASTTTTTTVPSPTTTTPGSSTTTTVPTPSTTAPGPTGPSAGYGPEETRALTTAAQGQLEISGTNWKPGTGVSVTVHSTPTLLGTLTASSTGSIVGSFVLPASVTAGAHSVVLDGSAPNGSPATVTLALTVTAAPAGSAPTTAAGRPTALAFTG